MKRLFILFLILGMMSACGHNAEMASEEAGGGMGKGRGGMSQGMGQGMGPGSGMMARHSASIDAEYRGLNNPISADEDSLARGEELYTSYCATCHGDGGMGDGPAGAALDPVPAPVAHTSQMMGDDYLFWRISESGAVEPFNSTMPGWKDALDEEARWDLVNYMRALGTGQVTPRQGMGGARFDPAVEAAQQAKMLAQGVEQGLITEQEAETFNLAHAAIDELRGQKQGNFTGSMVDMRDTMLAELVAAGTLTQTQADDFLETHDKLVEAGLMQ